MIGQTLSHYRITAAIGAGGMGEVYRATDTHLNRDVAIKVLPAGVVQDEERLARFRREAQLLASLNHPNIAAIHGLEQADGRPFLVLELVEGEDLKERLERGSVAVDEALGIAKQIAEALDEAHAKGIVHRDLKPANVKLTLDGQVKVLDFGLAKLLASTEDELASSELSHSPTMSRPTVAGAILGTAAYMSPEQARGLAVDKRSDIWAFGVVLFEMLTESRMFTGQTTSDVLAAVLTRDPEWAALPDSTPGSARRLLRRCLERNPKARLRDIGDARHELVEAMEGGSEALEGPSAPSPRQRALPWAIAAVSILALALTVVFGAFWHPSSPPAPIRVDARLGTERGLRPAALRRGPATILSPDGTQLAVVIIGDGHRIHVRSLEELVPRSIPGTEGAYSPFYSPDGQWIGFFARGQLHKVAVSGGSVVTLAEAPNARGGSWGDDGTIVFAPRAASGGGLQQVSVSGGEVRTLTSPDPDAGEAVHDWPQALPGGRVLYTAHGGTGSYDEASLVMEVLPDGPRKVVHRGGYHGRYLPSGHLLFVREGTLFAAPFDLEAMESTGPPVSVIEGLRVAPIVGGAQFSFSRAGSLVYVSRAEPKGSPIHWLGRDGTSTLLRSELAEWTAPRFSPDGRRLALMIWDGMQHDVWVYEWSRGTLTRVTTDPADDETPVWSPDGRHLAFLSTRGESGSPNIYWRAADGTGEVHPLTRGGGRWPGSWHPSGRFLSFSGTGGLRVLELEWDEASGWIPGAIGEPVPGFRSAFSPDGRFLAYTSRESGRLEVYVRSFPDLRKKWPVSADGGVGPMWSRTRPELLFSSLDNEIMVASYTTEGESLRVGRPRPWSGVRVEGGILDLHPDGERIAARLTGDESVHAPESVVLVFNFFEELRRLTADGGE